MLPVPSCSHIGTLLITLLLAWTWIYIAVGSTSKGKKWYIHNTVSGLFDDSKVGVIVMNLALPILVSGMIATVAMFTNATSRQYSLRRRLYIPGFLQKLIQITSQFRGWPVIFVLLPLASMWWSSMHAKKKHNVANIVAVVGITAMGLFLIPVTKLSPLHQFFRVSSEDHLWIHMWYGRIVFVCITIHGCLYILKWYNKDDENVLDNLFPNSDCWAAPRKCSHNFRNFTGIMGYIFLLLIQLSSLEWVRRNYYRFFYLAHISLSPITLGLIILHWHKSIIYLMPSLLYYLATTIPVMVEKWTCSAAHRAVVQIIDRQILECHSSGRSYAILTFAATPAAVSMFRAGQYVRIRTIATSSKCPSQLFGTTSKSTVSHPFTVNRVWKENGAMRIIVRVRGSFTKSLMSHETQSLQVDGYFGSQTRAHDLLYNHDAVTIVAGGIGITPYLSLLEDLLCPQGKQPPLHTKVTLNWICRDQALVDYIRKEYLDPLLRQRQSSSNYVEVLIMVYVTSDAPCHEMTDRPFRDEQGEQEVQEEEDESSLEKDDSNALATATGGEFCPTLYSAGSFYGVIDILIAGLTFSFTIGVGLWCIVFLYPTYGKKRLKERIYSILLCITAAFLVSILMILVVPLRRRDFRKSIGDGLFSLIHHTDSDENDIEGHHDEDENRVSRYEERHDGCRPCMQDVVDASALPSNSIVLFCGPSELRKDVEAAIGQGHCCGSATTKLVVDSFEL